MEEPNACRSESARDGTLDLGLRFGNVDRNLCVDSRL